MLERGLIAPLGGDCHLLKALRKRHCSARDRCVTVPQSEIHIVQVIPLFSRIASIFTADVALVIFKPPVFREAAEPSHGRCLAWRGRNRGHWRADIRATLSGQYRFRTSGNCRRSSGAMTRPLPARWRNESEAETSQPLY